MRMGMFGIQHCWVRPQSGVFFSNITSRVLHSLRVRNRHNFPAHWPQDSWPFCLNCPLLGVQSPGLPHPTPWWPRLPAAQAESTSLGGWGRFTWGPAHPNLRCLALEFTHFKNLNIKFKSLKHFVYTVVSPSRPQFADRQECYFVSLELPTTCHCRNVPPQTCKTLMAPGS